MKKGMFKGESVLITNQEIADYIKSLHKYSRFARNLQDFFLTLKIINKK